MHRFHLPPEQCQSPSLTLKDREAHHALHVLRLEPRARVLVLDGAGLELACVVTDAGRELVRLEVRERRKVPPLPFQITLLQAIPKGRLIEDIIEKATELGVARIVPLLAERVLTHLGAGEVETKVSRWRQTAVEAIKQCGNAWLPAIETPLNPRAFLERKETFDLALLGSLADAPCHLRTRLQTFRERHRRPPRSVCIWIGPEGDFTPAEVDLTKAGGALPISLGRLVLRCETAALYCLSVLHHELTE
jgi:16S rRNA (uracil1498-N3)-methyltransferase